MSIVRFHRSSALLLSPSNSPKVRVVINSKSQYLSGGKRKGPDGREMKKDLGCNTSVRAFKER